MSELIARAFRLIGDENRLKIICMIFEGRRMCVSDIAGRLNISVALVSHHLRKLAEAGMIVPLKSGKRTCYYLQKNNFSLDLKKFICKHINN